MASFSSTLLDSIYRSIDGQEHITTTTNNKKHGADVEDDDLASFRRSCMIEKWMDKKSTILRCKSMADFDRNPRNVRDHRHRQQPVLLNSSSSSSDSSSGGFSSESDISSTVKSTSKRPKPIRTTLEHGAAAAGGGGGGSAVKSNKSSRASRIYADLKKARQLQPVSPGGRLASFLNSVFNKKHGKIGSDNNNNNLGGSDHKPRTKSGSDNNNLGISAAFNKKHGNNNNKLGSDDSSLCGSYQKPRTKSTYKPVSDNNLGNSDLKPRIKSNSNNNNNNTGTASSTCSSASSYSRSCLSKTPSSNNTKRSVRFVDQELIVTEELRFERDLEEKRRVHEAAMELLKNYRQNQTDILNFHEQLDEDDDDASCASSDLFELDNLSAIGIDRRYDEELPVYETTHPGKNHSQRLRNLVFNF